MHKAAPRLARTQLFLAALPQHAGSGNMRTCIRHVGVNRASTINSFIVVVEVLLGPDTA